MTDRKVNKLAKVAVSDAGIFYDKLYTYSVPASFSGHIFVGSIVLIPFGRGKIKPRQGVVLELFHGEIDNRTKEILDVPKEETMLNEELLFIVKYLKETTFCTWFEAVRAVIPRGAQYQSVYKNDAWCLEKKVSRIFESVYHAAEISQEEKITDKQRRVLEYVAKTPATKAEIRDVCQVGDGVSATLLKKGFLIETKRDKEAQQDFTLLPRNAEKNKIASLSPSQQDVADELKAMMEQENPKPYLLHGVTGSGKTVVFLHLIQHALNMGKTALILVPEIGLTPQMLGALESAFSEKVAVQHSGLSVTQRVLQWRNIQSGKAKVVVGTRSAVFAPLDNIGLLVVDEEQEHTYQSESSPRYDAVSVARLRAAKHGALLLLASATPSISTYYFAKEKNRYNLLTLKERYGDLPLPKVEMVDMSQELLLGQGSALSERLTSAMEQTINEGRQVILLLNKRGYHRVALCKECGTAVKCEDCSVPMVYHKTQDDVNEKDDTAQGRLLCHHCKKSKDPAPKVCEECGGTLRYAGVGTQRLEEELAEKLPQARVLRMDMDTTQRKGAHAGMLSEFADGKADILLGTQMVAKGLDFERVGLVGVVGIDSLLFAQGYRAFEGAFSLVTQVVGRSGRANEAGSAIIQTVDPSHPVLQLAAKQDYEAFYEEEIGFRKLAMYPPYCVLCMVGFAAKVEENAQSAAIEFAQILTEKAKLHSKKKPIPLRVLGPSVMQVAKQGGNYRYRLSIKCRGDADFRMLMWDTLSEYNKKAWQNKVTVWLDFHTDG